MKTPCCMSEKLTRCISSPSAENYNALSTQSKMSKVGKKRTRASRSCPTIVMTADVSNFREKVEKFTGMPSSSSSYSSPPRAEFESAVSEGTVPLFKPMPQRLIDQTQWPACNNNSITSSSNMEASFMLPSLANSDACDLSASLPNFIVQPLLLPFDGRYSQNSVAPHDYEFLQYQYL